MKKLKLLLATVTASTLLSISALAATAQISFSDPTVTLGSEVNVTMKVKSTDGNLSRADITLNYDTTALQFISGTDADGGAGSVRVHGASNGAGTGTLEYNLKFNTLSPGQGSISIGTQEVYDTDESIVEITHNGSSTVSIQAENAASNDASLRELTISPGELNPGFSAATSDYEISVGTDVENLAINAVPNDTAAKVSISGNDVLDIGENSIIITVTAADGTTQSVYNLKVIKQDGAAETENQDSVTTNEGVKLSSKEKTITIMNPGSDVQLPDGFAESTIDIDGHQVRGWVWKADQNHEYCIVYGMNDAGDLNFYRYDLTEKTLQRYFSDPVEQEMQHNAEEYPMMEERYNQLVKRYNTQFILSCILGAISLILAAAMVILLRNSRNSKDDMSARKKVEKERVNKASDRNEEISEAGMKRPAAKRVEVGIENPELTHPDEDIREQIASPAEDELDATRAITDLHKQTETVSFSEDMELTKVLPSIKKEEISQKEGSLKEDKIEIEDLDIEEL